MLGTLRPGHLPDAGCVTPAASVAVSRLTIANVASASLAPCTSLKDFWINKLLLRNPLHRDAAGVTDER